MAKANSTSEGGAVDLEAWAQWADSGDSTVTPTEAVYEPLKEPGAGSDNRWNYLIKEDTKLLNGAVGELESRVSTAESDIATLQSDVSTLDSNFSSHTHDSRYYTKTNADDTFLTPAEGDARYYTQSAADSEFLTAAEGDSRYYTQTTADDLFVDAGGDRMTGYLEIQRTETSGEVDAKVTLHGHDQGEEIVEAYHDGTRRWVWGSGHYYQGNFVVSDKVSGVDVFELGIGGGDAIFRASELNATETDWIVLPTHTGSNPAAPSDGNVRIAARPDRTS